MRESELSALIAPLCAWYRENKRPLPWRDDPTPYHVWLSEIMLQQTRIEAVIPYYARFLEAAPTAGALAALDDDRLMKLWQGLGYYSRARNLKKAALAIVSDGGELPRTAEALRSLPGIGDYTAGAIASICFGEPAPAVDGNVLRVLTRLCGIEEDVTLPAVKKRLSDALRDVYPRGQEAGTLTQGLMELGETVCIPNGTPRCDACPLAALCTARAEHLTDRIPYKSPKKERRVQKKTVLLLSCMGQYAIRKRAERGLLAGLWEFPNFDGTLTEAQVWEQARALGAEPISVTPCVHATHIFTHVEWHMTGYEVLCATLPPELTCAAPQAIREEYAIPTAFRAFCDVLE